MTQSVRVGVVEIGSRAIRLLVADHQIGGGLTIVATDSAESRLAIAGNPSGSDQTRIISTIGEVASGYVKRCQEMQADRICVFGTEGLRRLSATQIARIKAAVPDLIVFDARREAECSLMAAAYGTGGTGMPGEIVAIDQGAASMELARGTISDGLLRVVASASHPLGTQPVVRRLTDCGGNFKYLRDALEPEILAIDLHPVRTATAPVLFGSAATKLAWINIRGDLSEQYTPRRVQGTRMQVQNIDQLLEIAGQQPDFVRQVIDPRGRDSGEYETVLAGLLVIGLLLKHAGIGSFTVSALGTRHGVAWQLISAIGMTMRSDIRTGS